MRMNARSVIAVLVLAFVGLVLGAWIWLSTAHETRAPLGVEPQASERGGESTDLEATESASSAVTTERATAKRESATSTEQRSKRQSTAVHLVRVDVFDSDGANVAGVELDSSLGSRTSDARGRVEFESDPGVVRPRAPWMLLAASPDSGADRALMVARSVLLGGRVENATRVPVQGAKIAVDMQVVTSAPTLRNWTWNIADEARIESDRDGRFSIIAPIVGGALLTADAPNCAPAAFAIPNGPKSDIVFRLAPPGEAGREVTGFVTHKDGSPAPRAIVRAGPRWARPAADGSFRIRIPPPSSSGVPPLIATETGHQSAIAREPGPNPVRLVLGDPPRSIRGRVVDAHGALKVGWRVELVNGDPYDEGAFPREGSESASSNRPSTFRTEDDGSFELNGLSDRYYSIQVWSEKELVKVVVERILAGRDDVVITVPDDAILPKLEGRVVARDGSGIANVRVRATLELHRAFGTTWNAPSDASTTDAEGRFVLENVPVRFAQIEVGGDGIVATARAVDQIDRSQPLVIEVARKCAFHFESRSGSTAVSAFEIRGERDEPLKVEVWSEPGMSSAGTRWKMSDVAGARLFVPENARSILYYDSNSAEVVRNGVRLVPGQNTAIGW